MERQASTLKELAEKTQHSVERKSNGDIWLVWVNPDGTRVHRFAYRCGDCGKWYDSLLPPAVVLGMGPMCSKCAPVISL